MENDAVVAGPTAATEPTEEEDNSGAAAATGSASVAENDDGLVMHIVTSEAIGIMV